MEQKLEAVFSLDYVFLFVSGLFALSWFEAKNILDLVYLFVLIYFYVRIKLHRWIKYH